MFFNFFLACISLCLNNCDKHLHLTIYMKPEAGKKNTLTYCPPFTKVFTSSFLLILDYWKLLALCILYWFYHILCFSFFGCVHNQCLSFYLHYISIFQSLRSSWCRQVRIFQHCPLFQKSALALQIASTLHLILNPLSLLQSLLTNHFAVYFLILFLTKMFPMLRFSSSSSLL